MSKKIPSKKSLTPKNTNEEVKTSVVVEKNNYGTKEVVSQKGIEIENDNNPISTLPEGKAIVGLSKGLTMNLGSYESARINCWISRVTNDTEKDIMDSLAEISQLIDEQVEFEANEILDSREN